MANRLVAFDAASLANLLTHYSQGEIPLGAEIRRVMSSAILPSWIGVVIESPSWENTPLASAGYGEQQPYVFRFEAGRILNWTDRHDELNWKEAIEAPRRTD